MDEVEWEIVRADIAMEKARLEANGDWAKWREFQARTNQRRAALAAPADWTQRARRKEGLGRRLGQAGRGITGKAAEAVAEAARAICRIGLGLVLHPPAIATAVRWALQDPAEDCAFSRFLAVHGAEGRL